MSTFVNTDPTAFKGVWVFCEQREGKLMPTDFELISEGRKLADDLGVELCGLLLGDKVEGLAKELGGYGADRIIVCEHPLLKDYTTDAYTKVICDVVMEKKPEIMLIGATNIGRDLGPRCAATLHTGLTADAVSGVYADLLADPFEQIVWMAITVLLGFFVCSRGLQNGIERIGKWMMGALFVLILVLAVHSFVLPGAGEGLAFYLLPDWNRAAEMGIGNVIVAAMNQAFFTLSLGVGAMEIFGSYMSRDYTLAGESLRICALDTCVAICSGLIIFPACFSYGVSPDAGPKLIFITLPNVFANMTGGRLWGTLFFVFMTFASFSTIIAVFQNILACLQESFGWSLKRACAVGTVFILLASVPCILGFNLWSGVQPMGPGSTVLDAEDFLVSNLLLPIGSLIYLLFCVTRWGWGFDNYLTEANTGKGLRLPRWFKPYFSVVLPLLIVFILVQGL